MSRLLKSIISLIFLLILAQEVLAQKLDQNIDKDSLFNVLITDLPTEAQEYWVDAYETENDQAKELFIFILSMPQSSKKELIENYDVHFKEIENLINRYESLVPKDLYVYIEFNPGNKIFQIEKSMDLKIYPKAEADEKIKSQQEWNLKKGSKKREQMLKRLQWTEQTIDEIEDLLMAAHCISIQNGEQCSIGFARSGMGKYSYLIFDEDLSPEQIEDFNDGCQYLYHKKKLVLEYGGGAIGSQCFPDK